MIIDGNHIKADEGKFLVNETVRGFGIECWLGIYDNIENWREITETEKERLEAEWEADTDAD